MGSQPNEDVPRLMTSPGGPVKAMLRARMNMSRLGRGVLDRLYPPACLHCRAHLDQAHGLCAKCWSGLRPITRPYCPVLGLPFEADLGPDVRSAEAIADPPPFNRARSAVAYNEISRALVSQFKFADRTELARFCAGLMASDCAELLGPDALLVAVPLHRRRQWQRRYNQSALLAAAVGRLTGLPTDPHLVMRARPTRQQVGLSARQRERNVQGAFVAHPDFLARAKGRRIVLVDDVLTTGSTVKAVTHALKRGGADHVDVISFARVVPGQDSSIYDPS